MRLHLAAALVLLVGCSSVQRALTKPVPPKQAPTLRQRPNFNGPHYAIPVSCIQRVEWYAGWCEDDPKVPNQHICHDVVLKTPPSCIVVSAK